MYKRILVGTDGSTTAATAVDRAVELAKVSGATLTILTAGTGDHAEQIVDREAGRHADADVKIDTRVDERDASTALVEVADEGDYDLLVIGNKGMTGATRFFLGSVPNKVSHHIQRSLLIVRTT
ncbi:MAG: universal stress protein [Acidimicrobiia bacterium]|nr:universal stress protein [Acidimicrobiia bacterium]